MPPPSLSISLSLSVCECMCVRGARCCKRPLPPWVHVTKPVKPRGTLPLIHGNNTRARTAHTCTHSNTYAYPHSPTRWAHAGPHARHNRTLTGHNHLSMRVKHIGEVLHMYNRGLGPWNQKQQAFWMASVWSCNTLALHRSRRLKRIPSSLETDACGTLIEGEFLSDLLLNPFATIRNNF